MATEPDSQIQSSRTYFNKLREGKSNPKGEPLYKRLPFIRSKETPNSENRASSKTSTMTPRLVGGVEIRERRPKYEGELRYKRLEFVKPTNTKDSEDWPLVRTTYPQSQGSLCKAPWENPQWSSLPHHQQRQLLKQWQELHPQSHGHEASPAPQTHDGGQPSELPERHQIVVLEDDSSEVSSDRGEVPLVRIVKPRESRHSAPRSSGHSISIFGSDSEDDRHSREDDRQSRDHWSIASVHTVNRRSDHRRQHRGW